MARNSFYAPPNITGGPTIIPPSAGDMEEARIRRLMDLAKLHELQMAPQFEQQRLSLGERTLGLQQQEATDRKTLGIRGQDVEQRGQDVQMRGQDIAAQTQTEDSRRALLAHAFSTVAARQDISLKQLAAVADHLGYPEVSQGVLDAHNDEQNDRAKKLTMALIATKKAGDTNNYMQTLEGIKNSPDAEEILPRIRATMQKQYPDLVGDLNAAKPNAQRAAAPNLASTLGEVLNVPLAAKKVGQLYDKIPIKKTFSDFYSGLTR